MTERQKLAAQFLAAMLHGHATVPPANFPYLVKQAYEFADAILARS